MLDEVLCWIIPRNILEFSDQSVSTHCLPLTISVSDLIEMEYRPFVKEFSCESYTNTVKNRN